MKSLDDLLQFILRHDHVIVFGNLGRYVNVVFEMFATIPQLDVAVQSQFYIFPSSPDNRIRAVRTLTDSCDIYILMEPDVNTLAIKPERATRMVIFTSHFNFKPATEALWSYVCYIHTPNLGTLAYRTKKLLDVRETSVQTKNINQVKVNSIHKKTIKGKLDPALTQSGTMVVIDLTLHTKPLVMFLAFLDAFDYMLANFNFVKGWLICFPEKKGRLAFDQFVQNCIDALFCHSFEHGNLKPVAQILSMLPYYDSGTVDFSLNLPIYHIGNLPYIAPKTPVEACKAAVRYNLEPWFGDIYGIKQ